MDGKEEIDIHQSAEKLIYIGKTMDTDEKIYYNFSNFMRSYMKMGTEWQEKIEQFICKLDQRVKIDITDPEHEMVVNVVHKIIANISRKMEEQYSKEFENRTIKISVQPSGSLFANLRVGRPYEADVMLMLPPDSVYTSDMLFFYHHVEDASQKVSETDCIIHGVIRHKSGVCLALEYLGNRKDESIGVLVDLIPIIHLVERFGTTELTENALEYFQTSDSSYVHKDQPLKRYQFHRETAGRNSRFLPDSAYLEHQILENLPENMKIGYRIAKYLLQSQLVTNDECLDHLGTAWRELSYEKNTTLFGFKPLVKSHILQVLVVQLFMNMDIAAKSMLQASALTLCLLDMLSSITEKDCAIKINNPLLRNEVEHMSFVDTNSFNYKFENTFVLFAIKHIAYSIFEHASEQDVALERFDLVNKPSNIYASYESFRSAKVSQSLPFDNFVKAIFAGKSLAFVSEFLEENTSFSPNQLAALHDSLGIQSTCRPAATFQMCHDDNATDALSDSGVPKQETSLGIAVPEGSALQYKDSTLPDVKVIEAVSVSEENNTLTVQDVGTKMPKSLGNLQYSVCSEEIVEDNLETVSESESVSKQQMAVLKRICNAASFCEKYLKLEEEFKKKSESESISEEEKAEFRKMQKWEFLVMMKEIMSLMLYEIEIGSGMIGAQLYKSTFKVMQGLLPESDKPTIQSLVSEQDNARKLQSKRLRSQFTNSMENFLALI